MLTLYYGPRTCALASLIALEESGLEHRVERLDMAAGAQKSDAYLKINPKGRVPALATERGILTGKLYEYLASGRPVLGIGPPDGDAARLLAETGGGGLFARDDVEGMAAFVREHYAAWAAGAPREGAPPEAVAAFSRQAQTGQIAAVLDAAAAR